jgi:hypothetical protein
MTSTLPSPFNMIASFWKCKLVQNNFIFDTLNMSIKNMNKDCYEKLMRCLVRRYVTREQRKMEETGPITEDHVKEIKQDIDCFKYELLDLLKYNGMKCREISGQFDKISGRKRRIRERRLLKGLSVGDHESLIFDNAINYQHMESDRVLIRSSTRKKFWTLPKNSERIEIDEKIEMDSKDMLE